MLTFCLLVVIGPIRVVPKLSEEKVSVVLSSHERVHTGTQGVTRDAVDSRSRVMRVILAIYMLESSQTCKWSSSPI